MSGRPGAGSRGRGGKFKKYTRGGKSYSTNHVPDTQDSLLIVSYFFPRVGGKHFSKNLRPLDADGNEISMWDPNASKQDGSDDDDDDSDDDSEEESEDDAGPSKATPAQELSREERRAEKKAKKEAAIARAKKANVQVGDLPPSDSEDESEDDNMPANPNHSKAARKQAVAPPKQPDDEVEEAAAGVAKLAVDKGGMTRKERESAEAAAAKERYMKAHLAGKTDEAKADMARLAKIREDRARQKAVRDVRSTHPFGTSCQ